MSAKDLEHYISKIEKVSPQDGDILLLRLNITENQMSESLVTSIGNLAGMLEDYGIQSPLIVLGKDSSLEVIDNDTLAKLGLSRIPTTDNTTLIDELYE